MADVEKLSSAFQALAASPTGTRESDEKLIISLDFGTTYSGIAFCFANQRNAQVTSVMHWPGTSGESVPKIPTLVNYGPSADNHFAWGASVDRKLDNIVGVKLLLDSRQELPLYLLTGNIKHDLKKLPKPPIDVAADFIGAMYQHALQEISKEVPDAYMKLCRKEFVLTVPAVWSDAAKNATFEAAKKAGIFPVTLIKEPEAAALYTIHSLDFALDIGDAFVVCDAGGGTVDLISYEIEEIAPQLKLKELVPGSGGRAGSLGLNQRFTEAVASLVGDDQFYRLKRTKGFALAEKQFDREVKKAFRGHQSEEYYVNFPVAGLEDDPDNGLESNSWHMTGKDVRKIFDPLITDILRLISDQVKSVAIKKPQAGVTGIILVGGFGSSQYLKACVEKANPGIKVFQPSDAWSAIVKGAALSKLPRSAKVVSTSATSHYGVDGHWPYDHTQDMGMPTLVDKCTGEKRCYRMTWYINIGDDLQRNKVIKFPFFRNIPHDYTPDDLLITTTLYACDDRVAPVHRSEGDKISANCTLLANLQDVSSSNFLECTNDMGDPYYRVGFDVVITIESAVMSFSLEMNGVKRGSVEAKFK